MRITVFLPAEALKNIANAEGLHLDPLKHRWVRDLPFHQQAHVVGEAIKRSFSPDLLKQPYRGKVENEGAHPCTGHCYVASEAFYHMMGGKDAGLKPMSIQHEGGPHWWVQSPHGHHDLTAEQFSTPVPHHAGVGKGFMSRNDADGKQLPSARAKTMMARAARHLDGGPSAFAEALKAAQLGLFGGEEEIVPKGRRGKRPSTVDSSIPKRYERGGGAEMDPNTHTAPAASREGLHQESRQVGGAHPHQQKFWVVNAQAAHAEAAHLTEADKKEAPGLGLSTHYSFEHIPLEHVEAPTPWSEAKTAAVREKLHQGHEVQPVRADFRDGKFHIGDGIHRVGVSREAGHTTIPAIVTRSREIPKHERNINEAAERVRDSIHGTADEARALVQRAVAAGADAATVKYFSAGGEGVLFRDKTGRVFKVGRLHGKGSASFGLSKNGLASEAEAGHALAQAGLAPKVHHYDAEHDVIVRDHVDGSPGSWKDQSALWDHHHKTVTGVLREAGFTRPEFKEDSYVFGLDGKPKMVDVGFTFPMGKRLAARLKAMDINESMPNQMDVQTDINHAFEDGALTYAEAHGMLSRLGPEQRQNGIGLLEMKARRLGISAPHPAPPGGTSAWSTPRVRHS